MAIIITKYLVVNIDDNGLITPGREIYDTKEETAFLMVSNECVLGTLTFEINDEVQERIQEYRDLLRQVLFVLNCCISILEIDGYSSIPADARLIQKKIKEILK